MRGIFIFRCIGSIYDICFDHHHKSLGVESVVANSMIESTDHYGRH